MKLHRILGRNVYILIENKDRNNKAIYLTKLKLFNKDI